MKLTLLGLGGFAFALSASAFTSTPAAAGSPFSPPQEVKKVICEELNMPYFPTMSLGECISGDRVVTLQNSGAAVIASCKGNEEFNPEWFYSVFDSVQECIQLQPKGPPHP